MVTNEAKVNKLENTICISHFKNAWEKPYEQTLS